MQETKEKILVAMSGGVDSCAAALMLHEEGHPVVGVAMQVWDYRKNGGNSSRATCCAPADFDDARDVANKYDFPFYVFDFEDSFNESVIEPFVNSYLNGYTPNPCLNCNRHVKFKALRDRAKALGCGKIATGHYAQIKQLTSGDYALFTSVDKNKDQSYFLYAMTQNDLKNTLFPVGGMEKPEVRKYLDQNDCEVASKDESQDICFVSSSVGSFIEKQKNLKARSGAIVNKEGETLGEHNGIYNYTVGQRKGLGLSAPNPLYVLNIDSSENTVVVGEKNELAQNSFVVKDINWILGKAPDSKIKSIVKLRYRHEGVLCEITPLDQESASISFIDNWSTVTPGQAAVFYAENAEEDSSFQVYGGGIIQKERA